MMFSTICLLKGLQRKLEEISLRFYQEDLFKYSCYLEEITGLGLRGMFNSSIVLVLYLIICTSCDSLVSSVDHSESSKAP